MAGIEPATRSSDEVTVNYTTEYLLRETIGIPDYFGFADKANEVTASITTQNLIIRETNVISIILA
jgi:hypothetical protein